MRIVTGYLKGRTIPFNSQQESSARLTSPMLKEAVFAILADDLPGNSFFDLCASSAQIDLEACSHDVHVRGILSTLQGRITNDAMFEHQDIKFTRPPQIPP